MTQPFSERRVRIVLELLAQGRRSFEAFCYKNGVQGAVFGGPGPAPHPEAWRRFMTAQHELLHIKIRRICKRWVRVWAERGEEPIHEVIEFIEYADEYAVLVKDWKINRNMSTLVTGRNFPTGLEDAIRFHLRDAIDLEYLHELTATQE